MKTLTVILIGFITGIVSAQDPQPAKDPATFSVSVSTVEIIAQTTATTTTTAVTESIIGGETIATDTDTQTETPVVTEAKENAGLVKVDEGWKIAQVDAFDTDFNLALVADTATGYLIRGPPGKYLVVIAVQTPEGDFNKLIPLVIDPIEGQEPPPPEPGDYSEVEKVSREKSLALNDPTTRQTIYDALGKAINAIDGLEVKQAEAAIVAAVESALLARTGASVRVDWINGWRKPVQAAIDEAGYTTTEQLKQAATANQNGLKTETQSATEVRTEPQQRTAPATVPSSGARAAAPVYVPQLRWKTRQVKRCAIDPQTGQQRCYLVDETYQVYE